MTHESETGSGARDRSGRVSRLTLNDLIGDLVWPKLLRVPSLAVRPERVLLGTLLVVFVAGLDALGAKVSGGESLASLFAGGWSGGFEVAMHDVSLASGAGDAIGRGIAGVLFALGEGFGAVLDEAWLRAIVLGPVMLAVATVLLLAIARVSALDFALGRGVSWPRAVGFAARHWSSIASAVLGPIAIIAGLWLLLAISGLVLLGIPVLNVVGALLWPLALVLSLVAVVLMVCMVLGGGLLVPAIACEDSDGIDAIQRSFSYALSKPLRLALYAGLAFVIGTVAIGLAGAAASAVTGFASGAAGAWGGERASAMAAGDTGEPWLVSGEDLTPQDERRYRNTEGFSAGLIGFFASIPGVLVAGFGVSYVGSAATVVYLLMRRVTDGQDIADLYMPDEIAARIDRTLDARSGQAEADSPASS